MTTLVLTVAGQRVTFAVDANGRYSNVRLQSLQGGPIELLAPHDVGPVLDNALRERILKHLTNAPRRP